MKKINSLNLISGLLLGSALFLTSCTKEAPIAPMEAPVGAKEVNAIAAQPSQENRQVIVNGYPADVIAGYRKPIYNQPTILAPDSLPMALIAQAYSGVSAKGFELSVWAFYPENPQYPYLVAPAPHAAKDGTSTAKIWLGKNDKVWVKISCEYGTVWVPTVRFSKAYVVVIPGTNVAFYFGSM